MGFEGEGHGAGFGGLGIVSIIPGMESAHIKVGSPDAGKW